MDFVTVVDQVIVLLRQRGRVTYSTLKRPFQLDDAALEDVKNELIEGQRLTADERGNIFVRRGDTASVVLSQIVLRRSYRGSCPCRCGDYAARE